MTNKDINPQDIDHNVKKGRLINSIYLWSKFVLIFAVCTGLFDLYSSYSGLRFYHHVESEPKTFRVQVGMNIVLTALYGIILPIQAVFFYQFSAAAKKSDLQPNSDAFSYGLERLLRQSIIATFLFAINAIWGVINILIVSM